MAGCFAPAKLTATAIAEMRSINRMRGRKVIRVSCPQAASYSDERTTGSGPHRRTDGKNAAARLLERGHAWWLWRSDDENRRFRLWLTLIASALCPEMVTRLDGQMGSAHGLIGSGQGARHEPHAWVRRGRRPPPRRP